MSPSLEVRATRLFRAAKRRFPALHPTGLRFVDDLRDGSWAYAWDIGKRGRPSLEIVISRSILELHGWEVAWDLVIHEYAHVLSWTRTHRSFKDHGPLWGAAYSMLYTGFEHLL